MLVSLSIRDFVIVDALELDFAEGFTALTGETGAGKSILIDALSLALGARAVAGGSVVRVGQSRAEISAQFDLAAHQGAQRWLKENELADTDPHVAILRRVLDSAGRSKSFINGSSVTLSQLRDLADQLVGIHGQHEHQTLLNRDAQLALLDDFADTGSVRSALKESFRAWQSLATTRASREANEAAITREFEELSWQIAELEKLDFTTTRWAELQAEQRRLANAAQLISVSEEAITALDETDAAALDIVERIAGALRSAAEADAGLNETVALLDSASVELREAISNLRHYLRRLDTDPQRLADTDRQIGDVLEVARKFRIDARRIPDFLQQKRDRLASLGGGQSLDELRAKEAAAEAHYRSIAKDLTKARQSAAKKFSLEVSRSLQELAMPGGKFAVEFTPREPSERGLESCEFLVAAHEAQALGALAKIASGGELSRVSLAIQMMASARGGVATMIFDEVDAGIGGRVAEVVGRLLRSLSCKEGAHQVFAVTHLPQVAACAHQQFQVAKAARDGMVTTRIRPLPEDERVDEIARMLGGIKITDKTRAAAEEMLRASNAST